MAKKYVSVYTQIKMYFVTPRNFTNSIPDLLLLYLYRIIRATNNKVSALVSLMSISFHDNVLFLYLLEIYRGFQEVLKKENSGTKWVKNIFRHRLYDELGINFSIISTLFALKCSALTLYCLGNEIWDLRYFKHMRLLKINKS